MVLLHYGVFQGNLYVNTFYITFVSLYYGSVYVLFINMFNSLIANVVCSLWLSIVGSARLLLIRFKNQAEFLK